jgi:type IV pilus biogenesis protein PilP
MSVKSLLGALLMIATAAHASDTAFTVAEMTNVQADRIMYDAQAARAKALAQLQQYGATPGAATGTVPPSLRLVYGAGGIVFGQFIYSTGAVAEGKAGDILPGKYRVVAVDLNGARLTDSAGHTVRVPFSGIAPVEPTKTQETATPQPFGMPPPPMQFAPPPAMNPNP